jgi:hypothetical protein
MGHGRSFWGIARRPQWPDRRALDAGDKHGGSPDDGAAKKAQKDSSEAVKAALLISRADRRMYGGLKDALANNYLLGNDQYPDTYDKAFRVLANYQVTKTSAIQGESG